MADMERTVVFKVRADYSDAERAAREYEQTQRRGLQIANQLLKSKNVYFQKLGKWLNKMNRQFGKFNMSILSTYFGGMALNMTFGRLVDTIANMMGASDALNLIWMDLLWDVVEPLVDILWDLTDVIEALPSPIKWLIGLGIVGLGLLGKVAMWFGMIQQMGPMIFGSAGVIPKAVQWTIKVFGKLKGILVTIGTKAIPLIHAAATRLIGAIGGLVQWFMGLSTVGKIVFGALAAIVIDFVINFIRYGFDIKKAVAATITDILGIIEAAVAVIQGVINAIIDKINAVLHWNIPRLNITGYIEGAKSSVLGWAGISAEEAPELARFGTTVNVFVEKLIGKDPDTLRDELNSVVFSGIGASGASVR